MILSDFFDHVNAAYRGTDDDAPVEGTPDHTLWLFTTNRKIHEYATDPDVLWRSRFEADRTIGTIAAGTQSYELDDDFFVPSDKVIVTTDNGDTEFKVVAPQDRGTELRTVYISGEDPKVLTFYDEITSDAEIVGGIITVPGYFIPDDLTSPNDTIPVDDPYWLVESVASELAFNDLTYEDKAADLVAKAINLWARMVKSNRRGTAGNPRIARTVVNRIPGSSQ